MTKTEALRLIKAMQTNSLAQREALYGVHKKFAVDTSVAVETAIRAAEVTIQTHIDALQRVLRVMEGEQ